MKNKVVNKKQGRLIDIIKVDNFFLSYLLLAGFVYLAGGIGWRSLFVLALLLACLKMIFFCLRGRLQYVVAKFDSKFIDLTASLQQEGFELKMMGNNIYIFEIKTIIMPSYSCMVQAKKDYCLVEGTKEVLERLVSSIDGLKLIEQVDNKDNQNKS